MRSRAFRSGPDVLSGFGLAPEGVAFPRFQPHPTAPGKWLQPDLVGLAATAFRRSVRHHRRRSGALVQRRAFSSHASAGQAQWTANRCICLNNHNSGRPLGRLGRLASIQADSAELVLSFGAHGVPVPQRVQHQARPTPASRKVKTAPNALPGVGGLCQRHHRGRITSRQSQRCISRSPTPLQCRGPDRVGSLSPPLRRAC